MHKSEDNMIFMITDFDGGRNDIGAAIVVDERITAEGIVDPNRKQQRCVIFKTENINYYVENKIVKYIVAVVYSEVLIKEFRPGEWVDAKEISGFSNYQEARLAFDGYGPNYLPGMQLVWSQITKQ